MRSGILAHSDPCKFSILSKPNLAKFSAMALFSDEVAFYVQWPEPVEQIRIRNFWSIWTKVSGHQARLFFSTFFDEVSGTTEKHAAYDLSHNSISYRCLFLIFLYVFYFICIGVSSIQRGILQAAVAQSRVIELPKYSDVNSNHSRYISWILEYHKKSFHHLVITVMSTFTKWNLKRKLKQIGLWSSIQ